MRDLVSKDSGFELTAYFKTLIHSGWPRYTKKHFWRIQFLVKTRFGEVGETARDKILRDHWRKRFGNEYDDNEEFKDPDGCGESKENEILGTVLNKLHDERFKGTYKDDDNLEGIIDYLEPTLYDGFIDLDDEEYKERKCKLLGMPYIKPPLILIEKVNVTRYSIGKSNLLFDAQKIQKNPIFQISVDILRNTNFFRAFSASASVPAVYIQQFWNSMKYDEKTGVYSCQVDEQWFNLSADLLRKALDITPVDPAHPFELPPTGDTVIDFVNQLGYPEPVEFVSNIRVNYVYQPWRAILTMINQCLTGKTSGSDKPRHPVLQMLWGIVTQTNVDHAELLWEEFTQGIQTFFSHKASHEASLKDPKKKAVPLLIPYGRFTKMIIYYLGSTSDVHKRPESPCHLPGDDFLLGNLKFISKGETNEVFGMTIPKQLITQAIQQSLYYPKYLEMVAKNTKKTPQDSASKQPEPATKRAPPKKPTTTTPVKPTKTPSSKQPKSPTKKPSKRKLPQKVRKGKPSFQLVDEDDEAQQESVPQEEGDDPDLELAKKMSLDAHQEKGEGEGADADIERAIKLSLDPAFLPQGRAPVGGVTIRDPVSETTTKLPEVVGKGKAIVTEEQVAHSLIDLSKKKRTTDQFILVRRDQAPHDSTTGPSSQPEDDTSEKVIHESSSTSDSERTESETEAAAPKGDKELGEVDSSTVSSGVSIPVSAQGQAGSDPEKAHEALAGPDPEPMQEDQTGSDSGKVHVSLAGPNPEHMDDEFLATAYPKVHENLKLITDERVIEDNPESHSGSMSSMKNLEDTDNFGDQFLYDKPIEDDQEKSKVVDESDSTIPDPTTTITTSLPEITPFIALQLRVARLEQEMSEVKKTNHSADVLASIKSHKYSVLPGPESIKNQEFKKSQKEIIKIKKEHGEEKQESTYSIRSTDKVALEEFDLKSALFKHMNKNKTANRNPANYHLYHALMEALIADEDAMDKEVKDRVKDHKRKHDSDDDEDDDDDEGPSAGSNQGKSAKRRRHDSGASGSAQPPPKDDEQSSKKPHDSDASASKQHPTLTLTGWQITDTRDVVIDSSMHSSEPESGHSEHSSDDVSKQDEGHVSDLEDTDNAHIPKVKAATWFKPIQEDERPATPEPEWTIPPNDFPEPENNWANAYATSYQVPAENKLQRKTYDIGSFIKWFCRQTGKKKLCKADLEGPAFNLVDLVNPEGHQILRDIYEPLPLGGPPGQVTIQPQFFFNKDLEYLLTGDKERKTALSISKLKAARYLDFGLEELILDANSQCDPCPDFQKIRIQLLERDNSLPSYKEYKISEKDFKNLHPNDFEDLYLLNIQDKLNHLSKSDKIHQHQQSNMWTQREDYTIVPKPRVVIYRDRNDQRKFMRLNEIHKFSDGTLTRVMEKLDHMVKDFHLLEYNKGMETRKWSEDDKRRSKDFISAIKKRLQIRRIFRSLESFVGGRIRDID
ncbi:hypothetical protein Tco_1517558 [Tanacetum coccineum]